MKHPDFDSETVELFGSKSSREQLRTKNVHEASILRFGWREAMKNRRREITSSKQKGETACAIPPEYAA